MSKIRILPEILSNKIAAGEVVERPASVVKELIENALDAGAGRIRIDVEKGGRSLIRVSDDGCGMGRDDAMLAVERYATSKIHSDTDLFAISSLGFRGEALPSIAAVSRFTLETRTRDDDAGVRIEIDGGKLKNVSEIGAPPGAQVTVRQLFFNTPARRKFLKTTATEMGRISDAAARIAMGWPEVRFTLVHNDRPVKTFSAVQDPLDRIIDVLGREAKKNFFPLDFKSDGLSVSGWIASASAVRSASGGIYIYVNGRSVRDRMVQHALCGGYGSRLMRGTFPVAVLYLDVPHDLVDVNVHPAKHEVRFARHRQVHDAVRDLVSATLARSDRRPAVSRAAPPAAPESAPRRPAPAPVTPSQASEVEEARGQYHPPPEASSPSVPTEARKDRPPPARDAQIPIWTETETPRLNVIGQALETYIICESREGLVLIDQHAAHERILYEKLKNRANADRPQAQNLLMPETLDLNHAETAVMEQMLPEFERIGLEIEPFGGDTYVVKSVPSMLQDRDIRAVILEILDKSAETGVSSDPGQAVDHCLKIMACHGAIRANQRLSRDQMQALIAQLDACETPSHCPHGRPVWIKWSGRHLEKSFKRIV